MFICGIRITLNFELDMGVGAVLCVNIYAIFHKQRQHIHLAIAIPGAVHLYEIYIRNSKYIQQQTQRVQKMMTSFRQCFSSRHHTLASIVLGIEKEFPYSLYFQQSIVLQFSIPSSDGEM